MSFSQHGETADWPEGAESNKWTKERERESFAARQETSFANDLHIFKASTLVMVEQLFRSVVL